MTSSEGGVPKPRQIDTEAVANRRRQSGRGLERRRGEGHYDTSKDFVSSVTPSGSAECSARALHFRFMSVAAVSR
jgi:hypothetical protein